MKRPYIIAGPRMARKASRLYLPRSFSRLPPQIIHRLRQRGFIITHLGKAGTAGGPPGGGTPGDAATDWDGATYATNGLGPSDVATFTYSGWLNRADSGNDRLMAESNQGIQLRLAADGSLVVEGRNSVGTLVLEGGTSIVIGDTGVWHHVKFTFDMGATPSNTIEVDGSDVTPTWNTETANENLHFTRVYGYPAEDNGASIFTGCLSEVWIDDSASTSVTDFRNAGTGKPEDLGADGSTPTGGQPLHYFPDGDPTDNKGSEDNWTLQAGTIGTCASAPAD